MKKVEVEEIACRQALRTARQAHAVALRDRSRVDLGSDRVNGDQPRLLVEQSSKSTPSIASANR